MKKILSLPEFRDYCGSLDFNRFIYSSSNQAWCNIDSTIHTEFAFNKMIVTFNPNIIYLKNGESSLRFNKVKAIKLHEDKCLLGQVFTVVCGDSQSKINDREYTLIAC